MILSTMLLMCCSPSDLPTEEEVFRALRRGGDECEKEVMSAVSKATWTEDFAVEFAAELQAEVAANVTLAVNYEPLIGMSIQPRRGVELVFVPDERFSLTYDGHVYHSFQSGSGYDRRSGIPKSRQIDIDNVWHMSTREPVYPDETSHVSCDTPDIHFSASREHRQPPHDGKHELYSNTVFVFEEKEQWVAIGHDLINENADDDGQSGEVCHDGNCRGLPKIDVSESIPPIAVPFSLPPFMQSLLAQIEERAEAER